MYASIVELEAESHSINPYVAEIYKLALEGKLYSGSISSTQRGHVRMKEKIMGNMRRSSDSLIKNWREEFIDCVNKKQPITHQFLLPYDLFFNRL
jgi:hypothetical protein